MREILAADGHTRFRPAGAVIHPRLAPRVVISGRPVLLHTVAVGRVDDGVLVAGLHRHRRREGQVPVVEEPGAVAGHRAGRDRGTRLVRHLRAAGDRIKPAGQHHARAAEQLEGIHSDQRERCAGAEHLCEPARGGHRNVGRALQRSGGLVHRIDIQRNVPSGYLWRHRRVDDLRGNRERAALA